jgi:SAM-dependent methyltransferase
MDGEPADTRSPERVREHYVIERELADRLRRAGSAERTTLYRSVYDELFQRVPDHPQLTRRADATAQAAAVDGHLRLLRPYLRPGCSFLELGPGDCALARAVAEVAGAVYAVDVSVEITRLADRPPNLQVILSDGREVPVPPGSIDVAYSDQLLEHLHPDDAPVQVAGVYRALAPGGCYVCLTPNRLTGPHDVSMYFDDEARGLHLREYTTQELARLFHEAGFVRVQTLVRTRWRAFALPVWTIAVLERTLEALPGRSGRALARGFPLSKLLGCVIVAWKAS